MLFLHGGIWIMRRKKSIENLWRRTSIICLGAKACYSRDQELKSNFGKIHGGWSLQHPVCSDCISEEIFLHQHYRWRKRRITVGNKKEWNWNINQIFLFKLNRLNYFLSKTNIKGASQRPLRNLSNFGITPILEVLMLWQHQEQ